MFPLLPSSGQASSEAGAASATLAADRSFGSLPPHFEPGVRDGEFVARRAGLAMTLDGAGAKVHLTRGSEEASLGLRLEGAAPRSALPEDPLPGVSNYFIGDDPRSWRTSVPHYARVRYEEVYPGIDLVYYGVEGTLEYDFLVAPGADPGRIRLRYDGAENVRIDDAGNLVLAVGDGEVVHRRPVTYQLIDGARREVASAFRILREAGQALVTFELGAYDARLPLTIDPVLTYATYLGGADRNDNLAAIAVDAAGATYLAGWTNSIDFPVTGGAFQGTRSGGFDAFVAKLNPAGTALEYATYLGGTGLEELHALRVDAGGNAYVTGQTFSADFPTTAGAAQSTNGGNNDVFVTKLNPTGTALLYSTYLGGSENEPSSDRIAGFEVDSAGNAYVFADTGSADFPVTPGAPQTTRGNPNAAQFDEDVFLTRITADGTSFAFSTYLGGSAIDATAESVGEIDLLHVDDAGNAWVAATTESADFPATVGAFDTTFNGPAGGIPGGGDGFVARYDITTGTLTWATLIGGTGDEFLQELVVDGAGNSYVAMRTVSANFPTTAGAPDTSYAGGNGDVGLAKLNAAGTALVYATFLGGGLQESPEGLHVDAAGIVTITGETRSPDFPTTPGAADTTHNGGADGFITRINAAGTALLWSTYAGSSDDESVFITRVDAAGSVYALLGDMTGDGALFGGGRAYESGWDDYFVKVHPNGGSFLDASYLGGTLDDFSTSMEIDAAENLYLAGMTQSSDFPVTAGAVQGTKAGAAGDEDLFLAKFSTTPAGPVAQPGALAFTVANFTVAESAGTASITVSRSGGSDGAVSATCTATSGGGNTATAGADYTAASVTLNWPDGDSANKICSVPILDDQDIEGDETFTVSLGNATGGATLGAAATVTITDDDVPPTPQPGTVSFNPATYNVNENGGSVTLTLTRTLGADGAISVSVTSGGGSASAGSDYTALTQSVNWADGDSAAKTVVLTILDDTTDEPNETVTVTLGNATGGATLGTATATVTIVDDDAPVVTPPTTQTVTVKGKYGGGSFDAWLLAGLGLCVLAVVARRRRDVTRHRGRRLVRAIAGAAVLAGAALPASADDGEWYVGVRGGISETTHKAGDIERGLALRGHDATVTLDDQQQAFSLLTGYRFAGGFTIEAALFDLGEFEVGVTGETTNPSGLLADTERLLGVSGRGLSTTFGWTIPAGERFEITPRVGVYYAESRQTVASSAGRIRDHEYGIDLTAGLRLAWRVGEAWKIGLDFDGWAADEFNDVRSIALVVTYAPGSK